MITLLQLVSQLCGLRQTQSLLKAESPPYRYYFTQNGEQCLDSAAVKFPQYSKEGGCQRLTASYVTDLAWGVALWKTCAQHTEGTDVSIASQSTHLRKNLQACVSRLVGHMSYKFTLHSPRKKGRARAPV